MVVQTGPLLPDVPGEGLGACGQVKGGPYRIQGGAGLKPAAVRAKVPGPVVGDPADDGKFGICLPAQADERVAFVVLEKDIVPGHVLLNEGVFQYQSLELAAYDDGVEVIHLPHHGVGFQVVAPAGLEILAHPVFQLFGLAYINDLPVPAVHQVHSGSQGQAVGFFQ